MARSEKRSEQLSVKAVKRCQIHVYVETWRACDVDEVRSVHSIIFGLGRIGVARLEWWFKVMRFDNICPALLP